MKKETCRAIKAQVIISITRVISTCCINPQIALATLDPVNNFSITMVIILFHANTTHFNYNVLHFVFRIFFFKSGFSPSMLVAPSLFRTVKPKLSCFSELEFGAGCLFTLTGVIIGVVIMFDATVQKSHTH